MILVSQINARLNGGDFHRVSPLVATRCYFFNTSKSSSEDNRTGASEDALAVGAGAIGAKDDSLAIGDYGSYTEEGGTTQRLANNATAANNGGVAVGSNSVLQTGGVRLGGNNSGEITVGYDAGAFQSALQSVGSNVSNAVNSAQQAAQQNLDAVLSQLAGLAESKQTDGESGKNQIVLYVVLAVVALLAWIFSRR